jgi:hypothetical protein
VKRRHANSEKLLPGQVEDHSLKKRIDKKMKHRILTTTAMSLVLLGAALVPAARADEADKTTIVTFNEPVEVPGAVLPAGSYEFKLADNEAENNVVQIFNADGTHLVTTVMAIPDYLAKTPDKTVMHFAERAAGQPEALTAWFYPGDNYGEQFVYSKKA